VDSGKDRLRRLWRARLTPPTPAGVAALIARLSDWVGTRGFDTVLATLPLPEEPDLTPFYQDWLRHGNRLALARTGPRRSMDFAFVSNLAGPWTVKRGGIQEPPLDAAGWRPGKPTLLLVPGLAFAPAKDGIVRLGRGGGYFDRWLSEYHDAVTTLGVGFSYQFTGALPREPHDVLLDGWMDETGWHGRRA